MPAFDSFPLWVNLAVLAVAAGIVWFSGLRLEDAVQTISRQTGLGSAFGGIILLAFSTSLPEVATTVSGAVIGNATLVTNNLIGGIAMQTAILGVADILFARRALTYETPRFPVLLGGVSLVLLLGLVLLLMAWGDPIVIAGVGIGSFALFATHLALVYASYRSRAQPGWQAVDDDSARSSKQEPKPRPRTDPHLDKKGDEAPPPLGRQWLIFVVCSLSILLSGWAVMLSAEAVAAQTGIAESFVGATLVAITTSLPEVSTTMAAVKRGDTEMAFANIFGSNMWCVSLLFVGDAFYRAGPLLAEGSKQTMFMGALGMVVTAVYLWGLLERKGRTIGRAGIDSAVVLALYVGGLAVLYSMG